MENNIAVVPAKQVEAWINRFEKAAKELADCQRQLHELKEDKLVTWEWVCWYFDINVKTARLMLQDENIVAYGRRVKRFKRSDMIRFAERHSLKVKNLEEVPPARRYTTRQEKEQSEPLPEI